MLIFLNFKTFIYWVSWRKQKHTENQGALYIEEIGFSIAYIYARVYTVLSTLYITLYNIYCIVYTIHGLTCTN